MSLSWGRWPCHPKGYRLLKYRYLVWFRSISISLCRNFLCKISAARNTPKHIVFSRIDRHNIDGGFQLVRGTTVGSHPFKNGISVDKVMCTDLFRECPGLSQRHDLRFSTAIVQTYEEGLKRTVGKIMGWIVTAASAMDITLHSFTSKNLKGNLSVPFHCMLHMPERFIGHFVSVRTKLPSLLSGRSAGHCTLCGVSFAMK